MDQQEKGRPTFPIETLIREHGIHRWELKSGEKVTALSAKSWKDFMDLLTEVTPEDQIIVSPELMTFDDQPFYELTSSKIGVESRVGDVVNFSKKIPKSLILLGTPDFDGVDKPTNSVLFIKNGEVIGKTNKRAPATVEERLNFTFIADEPAAVVPGTGLGLLICSDFPIAWVAANGDLERAGKIFELAGKKNLIGVNLTLVDPKVMGLIVPSCWGVGGNLSYMGDLNPDTYYKNQLLASSRLVLMQYPNLNEILMIDRAPEMGGVLQEFTPDKPYNALMQRQ